MKDNNFYETIKIIATIAIVLLLMYFLAIKIY